ncbi:MAG: hypothetical protein MUF15_26745 [Acidobacteria bacterium]|nr:hypothetical protein [Acidobacteriota bacterium]
MKFLKRKDFTMRETINEIEAEQIREARKLYMRAWRAKHRKKVFEYNQRFWLKQYEKQQESNSIKEEQTANE